MKCLKMLRANHFGMGSSTYLESAENGLHRLRNLFENWVIAEALLIYFGKGPCLLSTNQGGRTLIVHTHRRSTIFLESLNVTCLSIFLFPTSLGSDFMN